MYFPDKDYKNPGEAHQALDKNKAKLHSIFERAKLSQVESFRQTVATVIKDDYDVINMPSVRINAS